MKTIRTLLTVAFFSSMLIACTKQMPISNIVVVPVTPPVVPVVPVDSTSADTTAPIVPVDTVAVPPVDSTSAPIDSVKEFGVPLSITIQGFYGNDELVYVQVDGEEIFRATSVDVKHYDNWMQYSTPMPSGEVFTLPIRRIQAGRKITVYVEGGSDVNGKELQFRKDNSYSSDILNSYILNPNETTTQSFTVDSTYSNYQIFVISRV